jgi:hypothetical protein
VHSSLSPDVGADPTKWSVSAFTCRSERKWVMGQKLAVVVTGGTGKQGGAVVKSLLERGHDVRAVTRSTDSAKARELANAGVTLES